MDAVANARKDQTRCGTMDRLAAKGPRIRGEGFGARAIASNMDLLPRGASEEEFIFDGTKLECC